MRGESYGTGASVMTPVMLRAPLVGPAVDVGGCTHRGPRLEQEDALAWDSALGIYCVADGLGASGGGDVAAQAAVDRVMEFARGRNDWSAEKLAVESALAADTAVRQAQALRIDRCQTTLCVLVLRAGAAAVAWVGDSPLYRLRAGTSEQLTVSHRVPGRTNMVTRCLGARNPDQSEPEVKTLELRPGDAFALFTDGVSDVLAQELRDRHLNTIHDGSPGAAQRAAEALVNAALSVGSRDNCTAICTALRP